MPGETPPRASESVTTRLRRVLDYYAQEISHWRVRHAKGRTRSVDLPMTGAILFCLVVGISDGDTLRCLTDDQRQIDVRLVEIDAPEMRQAFGDRSREALGELCFKDRALVRTYGEDRYGRTLGRVTCGGVDANAKLVRRGLAWVYEKYVTDYGLYAVQDEARLNQRGLWADPHRVPPWEWRQQQASAGSGVSTGQAVPAPVAKLDGTLNQVRGSAKSGIYHVPGCRNYNDISQRNLRLFGSEAETRAAGYRKARNC